MPEFERYTERQERLDAVQFLKIEEASWFAEQIGRNPSVPWTLVKTSEYDFGITVNKESGPIDMSRGDYLVRSSTEYGPGIDRGVVKYHEFRAKWEKE